MFAHKEIKNVNLTIQKNSSYLETNKSKIPAKSTNNRENLFKLNKQNNCEANKISDFNFYNKINLKNPVALKEQNIKGKKDAVKNISFENKIIELFNENDFPLEKFESLPKIINNSKHAMSKSQFNFKSYLSESKNFQNNFNKEIDHIESKIKDSKRVVFTRCVNYLNNNNNNNIFFKSKEKKLDRQEENITIEHDNLSNLNNKKLGSVVHISNHDLFYEINKFKFPFNKKEVKETFNNNNNSNTLNINQNQLKRNSISLSNSSKNNLIINFETNSLLKNIMFSSSQKENQEINNSSINYNNSNSNMSLCFSKTPIKPKNLNRIYHRNFSTNFKFLDTNLDTIYDKSPQERNNMDFEKKSSGKISSQKTISSNYSLNENYNNFNENELLKTSKFNLNDNIFLDFHDAEKTKKEIDKQNCNASTNTNFFNRMKNVNLFLI